MSKKRVAPAPREPQPIPLEAITITWPAPCDFEGEDQTPIQINGRKLGQFLAWLARTAPGRFSQDWTTDAGEVSLRLVGVADTLRALGSAETAEVNMPAVFAFLADVASDLAGKLDTTETGYLATRMEKATVTIAPHAVPKAVTS